MSGSYPNNFNNNPMAVPRGHFSPQHQAQQPIPPNSAVNNSMHAGRGVPPAQHQYGAPIHTAGRGVLNPTQIQQPSAGGMLPVRQMQPFQSQLPIELAHNLRQHMPQMHPNQSAGFQQSATAPSATGNGFAISQQSSSKEINIVALSRLGQETVQDITSRFQEIFGALKVIQPTANRDNSNEKKVQEYFRTIRLLFKRLRIIYEKCNDGYPQGTEYAQVENLISFKDDVERRNELPQCEDYRKALQENQELIETIKLKNRQLREIIDRHRIIIWEINTMLSMRRS